jgi:hypothetical protein
VHYLIPILPPSINAIWAPDEQAKLVLNIESYTQRYSITVPSSKIKNILACSLGPQMGWMEEEKNG